MSDSELALLSRAHRLFAGATLPLPPSAAVQRHGDLLSRAAGSGVGSGQRGYRPAVTAQREELDSAAQIDAAAADIITAAHADHAHAREHTRQVLDAARADAVVAPDNPLAQREAMRRRAARLRAQRAHLLAARQRARQHRARLRRLRYPGGRHRGGRPAGRSLPPPDSRAGKAVRAALSRLGRPYVWAAAGPDRFDCSGLTQWAYAQAGIHLHRTTYEQIHDGIPVPRSQIRSGDLVFPNAGHVQLAIGNNQVVEAPHPGAVVRISPLGAQVTIRRPRA
ncbi:MAG TPA: C40 family peptidase [Mycobacterium sp.]|nr:C40 family peptidase [Mycobacterium sp.]